MMNEDHLPACIKYTERVARLCHGASLASEGLGGLALAVAIYEGGAGLIDVAQLNMDAAEQHGFAGGVSAISTLGLWAIGMAIIPRIQSALSERIHRQTDCAWDDEWQTDGGSGTRPTA